MNRNTLSHIAAASIALFGANAQATTLAPSSFAVTATLVPSCSIGTIGAIAFGSYTALTNATQSSTGTITCTNTLPYTLYWDAGTTNTVGTVSATTVGTTKTVTDTTTELAYNLSTTAVAAAGSGGAQTFTVNATMLNQAGKCATTSATCNFSHTRAIFLTY